MNCWLFKSEPESYSINHLRAEGVSDWTGVRNYQARNYMTQSMKVGDLGLFYHSNAEPPGVAGIVRVSASARPDMTAFDVKSKYFEPRATEADPVWQCVQIEFVQALPRLLSLGELRANSRLAAMELLRKGSRLSIQPVRREEFEEIMRMVESPATTLPAPAV